MRFILFLLLYLAPFTAISIEEDLNSLENLFVEKRCITCHVVGRGKFVGPDLYDALSKYSEEDILQWIQNPQAIYKKYSKMPINDGYPPMPYMNVDSSEAKRLLEYLKRTKGLVRKNSRVKISGTIKNFSENKLLDSQEVQLEFVMADKVKNTEKQITNNGNFIFNNLIGNIAYRIKIFYDGIEYSTDKFYFLPRENNKSVDLIVYDSTQKIKNLKVNSSHLIISYDEDSESIVVAEIINVENQSRNIFVGTNNFSEKIRKINSYALFPGIENLGFPHRSKETFIVSQENVIDTLPMPPGNRRIVLTYAKQLNFFSTTISKVFLNDISSLTIIVPENKLSFTLDGLEYIKKEAGIKELEDDQYSTYSTSDITKGQEIKLTFRKYDLFFNTKSVIGIIFILFMLGIFLYKRFKKT